VLIIGYYGAGNVGDEAVLTALAQGLRARRPDIRLIVPSENPVSLSDRFAVESFPPGDLERMADALDRVDAVIVGGGGLLHDYVFHEPALMFSHRHWGLPYYCGIPWLATELGAPVMLFAVGVGPLLHDESRVMVRDLTTGAVAMTVRDQESRDMLLDLGVPGERIQVTADPVWVLEPAPSDRLAAIRADEGIDGDDWMGVVVRNWPFDGEQEIWERELLDGIERFASTRGLRVVFVPFQRSPWALQDDVSQAKRLAAAIGGVESRVVVGASYQPDEVAGLLGGCAVVIAMRFHALVFAAMTETRVVALAYDPKVSRLVDAGGGKVPCLPISSLTGDGLFSALTTAMDDSHLPAELSLLTDSQRASAGRNLEVVHKVMTNAPRGRRTASSERILRAIREAEKLRQDRLNAHAPDPEVFGEQPQAPSSSEGPHSRLVRIIAPAFFDFDGMQLFRGGAERYLTELVPLIRELSYDVEIVQTANENAWERQHGDFVVRGLPSGGDPARLASVIRDTCPQDVALTIFLAFVQAADIRFDNTIGISHGVFWDDSIYHGEHGVEPQLITSITRAAANLDTMISVDANTVNWLRATRADLVERCVRIPNFVDLDVYRPPDSRPDDHIEIAFPRRLSAVRGFWLMHEVIPRILADHSDVRFRLVGQATEAWESGGIAAARDRLLEHHGARVEWQSLSPEEMPEVYASAHIVVIPTVASEGTSLACLEAQASGCAVVATPVGGLAELVIDGVTGLVADPRPESVYSAIDQLIRDPDLRRRLGENSAVAASSFSIQRWRSSWRRVLEAHLAPIAQDRPTDRVGVTDSPSLPGHIGPTAPEEPPKVSPNDLESWLARARRQFAEERARHQLLMERVQQEVLERERGDADRRVGEVHDQLESVRLRLESKVVQLDEARADLEVRQRQLEEWQTKAGDAEERGDGLARRLEELEQANAALAWKARGPLGRTLDRLLKPRSEGRLVFWTRSLYYAAAGAVLRLVGRRRHGADRDTAMMSQREHRLWRHRKLRRELLGVANQEERRAADHPGREPGQSIDASIETSGASRGGTDSGSRAAQEVFDDFRLDLELCPITWIMAPAPVSPPESEIMATLRRRATETGICLDPSHLAEPTLYPRLWFMTVSLTWADDPTTAQPPHDLPPTCLKVLLTNRRYPLPTEANDGWDLQAAIVPSTGASPQDGSGRPGWSVFENAEGFFLTLDDEIRQRHLNAVASMANDPPPADLDASVVVCTYRRSVILERCVRSLAEQTLASDRYEVIIVNNRPQDDLSGLVERLRRELFSDRPDRLRLILCPTPGLSSARNAGISEARGGIVCFIDDDGVAAPDWLATTLSAFEERPEAGVVGGTIQLVAPAPSPNWLESEIWRYWSHFEPPFDSLLAVEHWWDLPWGANWSARRAVLFAIGGFRASYGRSANNFGGGEEVVAAVLAQRLGHTVAVEPRSVVHHHVDPSRFTLADLAATIRAGSLVTYQLQRDLYIPREIGPKDVAVRIATKSLKSAISGGSNAGRLARYGLRGDLAVLRVMIRDYRERLRG